MKNTIISLMILLSSVLNAQNYEGVWQDVENKNLIMIINKISYDDFKITNYDLNNEVFTDETFLNSYEGMTTYYQDYTEKISYELNYLILNDEMHCYNELELASVYKKID
jgi:hypothetical protein